MALFSKQQISDIQKNKEKMIVKFAGNLETSEGLKQKSLKVAHEQLVKVLSHELMLLP